MLPVFKFSVSFDEGYETHTIKRFIQVKDITEHYGIPKASIYKLINNKMDYEYSIWKDFIIKRINEPAYLLLEF